MQAWSLVVTKLDPAAAENLQGLEASINALRGTDEAVTYFFNDFLRTQIKSLRPGVTKLVATILKDISNEYSNTLDAGTLLDKLVINLSNQISDRKPTVADSTCAKIGLFHVNTFTPYMDWDEDEFFHNRSFLNDHLFYLMNPCCPDDWSFLTTVSYSVNCLKTYDKRTRASSNWDTQLTYFEPNEILTFLACVAAPLKLSVTYILGEASQQNIATGNKVFEGPKPYALFLPGNTLEVSSSSSIIDATNHCPRLAGNSPDRKQDQVFSLKGQSGEYFLANLFENLFRTDLFKKKFGVQLIYRDSGNFNLGEFLRSLKFPCLYGIGRQIDLFENLSNIPGSQVFMRSFFRGANSDEVDGYFEIKDSAGSLHKVGVECKYRNKPIGVLELLTPILPKIQGLGIILGLIFCHDAVTTPSESSALSEYCRANRINIFRSKMIRNGADSECAQIEISPFLNSDSIVPNPNQVVFIFESVAMDHNTCAII